MMQLMIMLSHISCSFTTITRYVNDLAVQSVLVIIYTSISPTNLVHKLHLRLVF